MRQDPPAPPACDGVDPVIFDYPSTPHGGLALCSICEVRSWCLREVDPARHFFDGVAGGHVWTNGKPNPHLTDLEGDEVLQLYLATRPKMRRGPELDHAAIALFVEGTLPWNRLSKAERVEAAKLMIRKGIGVGEVQTRTHLSGQSMADLVRNPTNDN